VSSLSYGILFKFGFGWLFNLLLGPGISCQERALFLKWELSVGTRSAVAALCALLPYLEARVVVDSAP
jgi:hypothetical protein